MIQLASSAGLLDNFVLIIDNFGFAVDNIELVLNKLVSSRVTELDDGVLLEVVARQADVTWK
jgi:hypothetical protein